MCTHTLPVAARWVAALVKLVATSRDWSPLRLVLLRFTEPLLVALFAVHSYGSNHIAGYATCSNVQRMCARTFIVWWASRQCLQVRVFSYDLCALRHIHKSLPYDVTKTVACSIVSSRLDYCNALYYNLSSVNLAKFQRVQETLARVVLRQRKYDHITPALVHLHW